MLGYNLTIGNLTTRPFGCAHQDIDVIGYAPKRLESLYSEAGRARGVAYPLRATWVATSFATK